MPRLTHFVGYGIALFCFVTYWDQGLSETGIGLLILMGASGALVSYGLYEHHHIEWWGSQYWQDEHDNLYRVVKQTVLFPLQKGKYLIGNWWQDEEGWLQREMEGYALDQIDTRIYARITKRHKDGRLEVIHTNNDQHCILTPYTQSTEWEG